MKKTDKPEFLSIMTVLSEIYDTEVSDAKIEIYFEALKGTSIEQLKLATAEHVKTSKFFPKPAELIEAEPDHDLDALREYQEARKMCSSVGSYRRPKFDNPRTEKTIKLMGGWFYFCITEQPEHWIQKEFMRIFLSLQHEDERLAIGAGAKKQLKP